MLPLFFMSPIELLAPAGSYEALHTAIHAGCDAVYFGVSGYNMRANTSEAFSIEDLREIARICHEKQIKCYLALNTLVYDEGLDGMKKIIDAVKEAQVDAVILFDLSVMQYAREQGVEVHISTQHSISNIEAVKFFAQWADRLVLARELTLEQIKHITEQIKDQNICGPKGRLVEIEVFVHGAMCVAVSGRCGMSLYMYNTSANCGACSQPCRRAFTVTDKATGKQLDVENEYVMSTQDLCTIGMLDEIVKSGAVSLKIEGRGRAAEYVDVVVGCYREALASIEQDTYKKEKIADWNKRLGTVFNRGMSEGFYRGLAFKYWSGAESSKATQIREFVGVVRNYYADISVAEIELQAAPIKENDECLILSKTDGVIRLIAKDMRKDDQPINQAVQKEWITLKVSQPIKHGDKLYKIKNTP